MKFEERVLLNELSLNDTDDQIIDYIRENTRVVVNQSIQKTAQELFTVPNSIMRLSRKLGYNGFSEMKFAIKQELNEEDINRQQNGSTKNIIKNELKEIDKISEQLKGVHYFPENILRTLNLVNTSIVERSAKKISEAKSVKFLGIGDSIYFCEMFCKNLRCVGKKSEFFQHRHDMIYSVNNCDNKDLYIAISVSGESSQIIEAVEKAKKNGAYVISVTHFSDNSLSKLADINLFFWAPREDKNNYNATDRVGLMILIRILSEVFWEIYGE